MTDIVYCDDESTFQAAFQRRHSSPTTHITMTNDVTGLPAFLASMHRPPDLLVLDLFHTTEAPGSSEADAINHEIEARLQDVDLAVAKLKEVVTAGKRPAALEALRDIRRDHRLAKLPVLLYTRQGLSLLDDSQLNEAMVLGAEWMLKGRGQEFERGRMLSFIATQRSLRRRVRRDMALMIAGALLAFVLERGYHLLKAFSKV
jgi:hypothetical protein